MADKYDRLGIAKEVHTIDIADLRIKEGLNKRIDYGDLEYLAHSIYENGCMEPIRYFLEATNDDNPSYKKKDKGWNIFITEGHRRYQAIQWGYDNIPGMREKITTIQGINSGKYTNEEDWLKQQILLNEKKQFTPLEKAKVYKRLIDLNWDIQRICREFNTVYANVNDLLKLAASPTQVQQLVEDGKITANAVIATIDEVQEEVGRDNNNITEVYQEAVKVTAASGSKGKGSPKHVKTALEAKKPKRKASEIPLTEKSDKQLLETLFSLGYTKALAGGITEIRIPSEVWDAIIVRLNK